MCENVKFIEEEDEKESLILEQKDIQVAIPVDMPTGTGDYEELINKPKINGVELIKNKTSKDLKLQDEMDSLTNMEIERLLGGN